MTIIWGMPIPLFTVGNNIIIVLVRNLKIDLRSPLMPCLGRTQNIGIVLILRPGGWGFDFHHDSTIFFWLS